MLYQLADNHRKFLKNNFVDADGLLVSVVCDRPHKPFTESEMDGFEVDIPPEEGTKSGYWNYEDSWMVMGSYIKSLAIQMEVVSTVDVGNGKRASDAVLDEADGLLAAIERMQSKNSHPGLLTKPYGGKPSQELSIDQYAELFFGLHELAKVAPLSIKKRIANLMGVWADFWIESDYRWPYFGHGCFWACQPHALVCLTIMLIAVENTSERRFRDEAVRLCKLYQADKAPLRTTMSWQDPQGHYRIRTAALFQHLVAEGLYYLIDLWPERKEEWLDKLYQWWKYEINLGVDNDGLTYWCLQVHLPTNSWQPMERQKVTDSSDWENHPQFSYVHKCKSGSASAHIAATAVRVAERLPHCKEEAVALARFILELLDGPERMKFYIDPDGKQLGEHEKQLGSSVHGKSYAQWLCAYWHGRRSGYWT